MSVSFQNLLNSPFDASVEDSDSDVKKPHIHNFLKLLPPYILASWLRRFHLQDGWMQDAAPKRRHPPKRPIRLGL